MTNKKIQKTPYDTQIDAHQKQIQSLIKVIKKQEQQIGVLNKKISRIQDGNRRLGIDINQIKQTINQITQTLKG